MKKNILLSQVWVQVRICGGVLFVIYMAAAILDNNEADMLSELGLLVVQPIIGTVKIAVTIAVCLLAGLPIRLVARLQEWWIKRPLIPLVGILCGIVFFAIAFNVDFMEAKKAMGDDGELKLKFVPNYRLSVAG